MSCTDNTCGTGGWNGPKPGDPDNNLILSANTSYGGINVVWSYPVVNGHAVSYTRLFRGLSSNLAAAVELGKVGGSMYFDKLNPAVRTEYFYWIQVVSVNGTVADPIGPVSAYAEPLAQQTLETLTGLIDTGQLSQDLKTSISGITNNNAAIFQEIQDRLYANEQFAAAMADVQNGLTQAMTFINQEVVARQDGINAMVTSYNTIAAANAQALAAIDEERTVRVGQNSAMARDITSLITKVGDSTAGLVHDVALNSTSISANARDITTLATTVGNSSAGLVHDVNALSTAVGSQAYDINTIESTLNGNTSTGQVGLITQVGTAKTTADNAYSLANGIKAEYFVKLQVNGLIGGFGIYNDGATVEAGFDLDRFWVGRTQANKVKPFIIDNDTVYIDKARIRNADIDTLKVAGNAITGLAVGYSSGSVPASGSTNIADVSLTMPSGSSGVVLSATASLYCADNASVTMAILKNGYQIGSTGVSLQGGFHATASYTAVDQSPGGTATYTLQLSNPGSGIPGGNKTVSVDSCSIIASGAKR